MSKSDPSALKKERNKTIRWVVTIFIVTIFISATISFASTNLLEISPTILKFTILLVIIFIGIIFDIVGVAVTSADEKPFHSMAARKVSGAQEAITLLRNAERVSSICNDVIGDICGVISGSASAAIAAIVIRDFSGSIQQVVMLGMSALVAGLTVGGKAVGKTYAIRSCTSIVTFAGKVIWFVRSPSKLFRKKRKK